MGNAEIIKKGEWAPRQLKIRIGQKYRITKKQRKDISETWKRVKGKFFNGNTIRICGSFPGEKNIFTSRQNLVLNVHRSKYKDGCVVGFLGFTMIPITSDGYVVFYANKKNRQNQENCVSPGSFLAGGTPEDTDVMHYVIEEMKEEFGVVITQDDLTIHGITETSMVKHGIEIPNICLVVKVDTKITKDVFKECWKGAVDKEAKDLKFIKLDYIRKKINLKKKVRSDYQIPSYVHLGMIAESEFGVPYEGEWWKDNRCTSFK